MNVIFASQFADEIASVAAGGDGLLRQRLASLDPDERRMLREALAEPELPEETADRLGPGFRSLWLRREQVTHATHPPRQW
jgi:hypothetical protein